VHLRVTQLLILHPYGRHHLFPLLIVLNVLFVFRSIERVSHDDVTMDGLVISSPPSLADLVPTPTIPRSPPLSLLHLPLFYFFATMQLVDKATMKISSS